MTTELIQNTPEWLEMRRKRIGASDAPVIMEMSPWKTPYQLWIEKTTGITSSTAPQQKRGLELEEMARRAFEQKTGMIMFPKVMFHPSLDWMMASLDGIDIDSKAIVEIKCPGQIDHAVAQAGKIPEKYFPQLQHQLAVTGLNMAFYFSFDGNGGVIVEVGRDESFITEMINQEKKFWNNMTSLNPPPMNERDFVNREDERWKETSQKWLAIHSQIEALECEEKNLREALIQMAGSQNATGCGIRLTRSLRKGNVNYSQIPELKLVDLEKHRKEPIEVWRLSAT
jgi:putative phage-type endonuclease